MSVQADDALKEYPGNGAAVLFDGPRLFDADTLTVSLVDDATGAVTSPSYTLTNVGVNGPCVVQMDVAPPLDYTLQLRRTLPYAQTADFTNQQTLLRRVVENTFDVVVMLIQQLADGVKRSFKLGDNVIGVDATLPAPTPLAYWRWNGAGKAVEYVFPDVYSAPGGSDQVGFLQAGSGAVARTAQDKMRDLFSVKDFGATGNGTTDDTAGVQLALAAATRGVYFPPGTYRITSALTLTGKTDFAIVSDGATIYVDAAITGLTISNMDGFKAHGELNFTGIVSATGFNINTIANSQFGGFRAKGIAIGGILGTPSNKTYGGVSVPDQTRLHGFTAIGCGVGFRVDGEYYEMVSPQIMGCSSYGLHVRGGNFSATGGIINGNRIGVYVQGGVLANSDHGKIVGVTMNHNLAANLYIKDTDFSFHVTGCDLWAAIGDGTANGQLTEAGRTTSFGVYLQNCDNINMVGNTIARNRVNVGIDGIATSVLSNNHYITDSARTTSHLKEYGANHSTYGLNAQNIYGPNAFEGALLGGGTARYELLTSNLTQANRLGRSVGTTGSNMSKADGTVTGSYDFVGDNELLYLTSDTPATVTVSSALSNQTFGVLFDSVSAGTKAVTFTGALGIVTQTAGVTVVGNVVTFKNDGLYIFSPTADLRWTISCAGGSEAVLTPAFTGAWANLAGGFETVGYWKDINGDVVLRGAMNVLGVSNTSAFTLPVGYRPAAKVAMPIGCDAGKSGFVVVNIDGTVVPTYEAASTFVSLSGLRFRVN